MSYQTIIKVFSSQSIKILLPILFIVGLLGSCSKKNEFSIEVNIENIPTKVTKAYLYASDGADMMIPIDSVTISPKSAFKFTKNYEKTNLYQLVVGKRFYLLITQNGENVKINSNFNTQTYDIQGSEASLKIKSLNIILTESFEKSQQIFTQMDDEVRIKHQNPDEVFEKYESQLNTINQQQIEKTLTFAQQNQTSLTGFYALLTLRTVDKDFIAPFESQIFSIANHLVQHLKDNDQVQQYASYITQAQHISIGQIAPEIILANPEGKTLKLSDLRGQYVLIDFWASWCGPCRHENPNVVKQYQLYKNKGFTIFSISLDNKTEAWKKAIKEDQLTWANHVSDLKGWESNVAKQYHIESIPSSFLIDPKGKIIAKNLRGEILGSTLAKLIK